MENEHENLKRLLVIPQSMINEILNQAHDLMGHQGIDKTLDLVRDRVWWPGHTRSVEDWILKCPACSARKKVLGGGIQARLESTPV